jgi:hypothetical protein
MTGRMDWKKARVYRSREHKLGQGVLLSNGALTPRLSRDPLARRAELAMRNWLPSLRPKDRDKIGVE